MIFIFLEEKYESQCNFGHNLQINVSFIIILLPLPLFSLPSSPPLLSHCILFLLLFLHLFHLLFNCCYNPNTIVLLLLLLIYCTTISTPLLLLSLFCAVIVPPPPPPPLGPRPLLLYCYLSCFSCASTTTTTSSCQYLVRAWGRHTLCLP